MTETELVLSEVRQKSEEQNIPFSHLMSAFMLEEMLFYLSDPCFGERLLLRNREELSPSVYREKVVHRLLYYDPGEFQEKEIKNLFHRLTERDPDGRITWSNSLEFTEEKAIIYVTGKIGKISVPFEIEISPVSSDTVFETEEFRPFFSGNRRFSIRRYPKEAMLSEAVRLILGKLELIGDMMPYDRAYRILTRENLNVRHLFLMLEKQWEEAGILREDNYFTIFEGYRDYGYMKKKWKSYLKRKKKTEPLWEEIMDLLITFLAPVWGAYRNNEVFFGDWISDLRRYL